MNFKEYIPLAMRTVNDDLDITDKLLNACMGLVGEYAEYIEVPYSDVEKKIEELGDIHWYVALLSNVADYQERPFTPTEDNLLSLIGLLCDTVKKHAFQGHELSMDFTDIIISRILKCLEIECKKLRITQSDVMRNNVEKLERRYPSGFSSEMSVNRVE